MQIGSLIMMMDSIGVMLGLFLLFSLEYMVMRGMFPALVVCSDLNWVEDRSEHLMYDHIVGSGLGLDWDLYLSHKGSDWYLPCA